MDALSGVPTPQMSGDYNVRMALRARIRRGLKWVGLAVCVLTALGSWAWAFSPEGWTPHPHYFGARCGFVVGRAYLRISYVTIVPPPGKTTRDLTLTEEASVVGIISGTRVDDIIPGYDAWDHAGWLPTLRKFRIPSRQYFRITHYKLYFPLITFPLLILIPIGIVTSLLWYLDRRRSRPGHCEDCGYDLTGNVSGRCPECGATIARLGDAAEPEA